MHTFIGIFCNIPETTSVVETVLGDQETKPKVQPWIEEHELVTETSGFPIWSCIQK